MRIDDSVNLNNCVLMGTNYYWGASVPTNAPWPQGIMFCQFYKGTGTLGQVCIYTAASNPKRVIRYQDGSGNWGAWKRIYDETILTDSEILSPLASALGGVRISYEGNSLDDLKTPGRYSCSSSLLPGSHIGTIDVVEVAGGRYVQTVYQPTLRRTIQRTFNGTSWGDWGNCNGFNCMSAEDLASLLGVKAKAVNYITQNHTFDFDTIDIDKEYGIQIHGNAKILNSWLGSGEHSIPTSAIVTSTGRGSNAGVVWCTAYDGSFCYIRTKFDGWRVWKQIPLT